MLGGKKTKSSDKSPHAALFGKINYFLRFIYNAAQLSLKKWWEGTSVHKSQLSGELEWG